MGNPINKVEGDKYRFKRPFRVYPRIDVYPLNTLRCPMGQCVPRGMRGFLDAITEGNCHSVICQLW